MVSHDNDSTDGQQSTVDYSRHFGQEGNSRQLASLRVLLSAFTGVPGIIGLHGGLPPADAFPFTDMSFTLRDGTKLHISDPAQVHCDGGDPCTCVTSSLLTFFTDVDAYTVCLDAAMATTCSENNQGYCDSITICIACRWLQHSNTV